MIIPFPDGSRKRTTTMRDTNNLYSQGIGDYLGKKASAQYEAGKPGQWRVSIAGFVIYLRHDPEAHAYLGGGWPDSVTTGYVLRQEDPGTLVLEVWDVADDARGPDWVDGVDGVDG